MKKERLCCLCIGEWFLRKEAQDAGNSFTCSLCSRLGSCIDLERLSPRLESAILNKFTPESDFSDGLPRAYTVATTQMLLRILGIESRFGRKLLGIAKRWLPEYSNLGATWQEMLLGRWMEGAPPSHLGEDLSGIIRYCGDRLRFENRFFNQEVEGVIEDIFREAAKAPVGLVEDFDISSDLRVFRARRVASESEVAGILKQPVSELGAPPSELAREGRLNASGSSVLYCSLDEDTCIAEVRPAVGEFVVVGEFRLIRPLSLLSLDTIGTYEDLISPFDPAYHDHVRSLALLTRLAEMIMNPVSEKSNPGSYLLSQYVAEFIESRFSPKTHGLKLVSTQNPSGKNLCLFRKHTLISYPHRADISAMFRKKIKNWHPNNFEVDFSAKFPASVDPEQIYVPGEPLGDLRRVQGPALLQLVSVNIHAITSVSFGSELQPLKVAKSSVRRFRLTRKRKNPASSWMVEEDDDIPF